MRHPKFFIKDGIVNNGIITIINDDANHIKNALRLKPGDVVAVSTSNEDCICKIINFKDNGVQLKVISSENFIGEPEYKVTLFQAVLKGDKMELAIQKCVELGVYEIVPVITDNTVVKPVGSFKEKIKRYNRVSESAAKQSGRGIIPAVADFLPLYEALHMAHGFGIKFIAHEKEKSCKIKDILNRNMEAEDKKAGIFIGPEGGFTDDEIESAKNFNIKAVKICNRVLRAETAAFTALTIFLYETEDL